MAPVYSPPLIKHVFCFSIRRIGRSVSVDVRTDVGEKVRSFSGLGYGGFQADEFAAVIEEDFAMAGEVVLFESGGGQDGFGVEEAGELGDEGFSLLNRRVSRDAGSV